jgi:high-affinity iron transporter
MLPTFIILFREILEISIILSIVLAATQGVPGRSRWIGIGMAGGVAGSAAVAFFAGAISEAMEGMGQELFNAGILFVAVLMIGWTVVWMQQHGKELAQKIKHVGHSVQKGELPLYALAVIVSLSMWREGAEIVLFMYGILSTTQESLLAIIAGGMAGTLAAAVLGLLIYLGLIKLSTRYVFTVTSALLILLACGMSAQAAGYLVAAGMLPDLMPQLWDSSFLLSESSLVGKILHAMLGYTERPTGIQAVFYVVTFAVIFGLTRLKKRTPAAVAKTVAVVAAASVLLLCATSLPSHAKEAMPEYEIELENGKFSPSVLRVPSGKKFKLEVENEDSEGTLEFSIPSLGFELAVTPGQEYESYLGPLDAGEYPFEDALDSSRKGILKVE